MTRLSININKIATLRNSRGGVNPAPRMAADTCIRAGAAGLTLHWRQDNRHTREADVRELCELARQRRVEFNLEGDALRHVQGLIDQIDDAALAAKGKETVPHVTVKYGLHGSDAGPVRELAETFGPVQITLGKVALQVNPPTVAVRWRFSLPPSSGHDSVMYAWLMPRFDSRRR